MSAQPVHGADISHHQASVDLAKAKAAGLGFLFHKCTQGQGYVDPRYAVRRGIARELGLPFGAYHFAETGDPVSQARRFLKVAALRPGDMRPMLDLEDTTGSSFSRMSVKARTQWVGDFVAEVKHELGVLPFIYTPFDLSDHFGCPLWVARYNNANKPPHVPKPWRTYTVWQFSNGVFGNPRSFTGLGHVDLNTWNGEPPTRMLRAFRLPAKAVAVPPKVTPPKPPAGLHGVDDVWFGKPMPAASSRLHLSHGLDQWLGDSRESVRQAAALPVGADHGRYVDNNVQPCKDDDVIAHGSTPAANGYGYLCVIGTGGRVRVKLSDRLLHRPFTEWKAKDIARLRRTLRKGDSWESQVAIETVGARMDYCKAEGVIPFLELKHPIYGTAAGLPRVKRMVAHAKKIDLPPFFMALDTMSGAEGKARNCHAAAAPFALLGHEAKMPANFADWDEFVTHVYGRNWMGK